MKQKQGKEQTSKEITTPPHHEKNNGRIDGWAHLQANIKSNQGQFQRFETFSNNKRIRESQQRSCGVPFQVNNSQRRFQWRFTH